MAELTHLFHPTAEVIAASNRKDGRGVKANQERILSVLQPRSCTAKQITDMFGMHLNEVLKYLGKLMRTGTNG